MSRLTGTQEWSCAEQFRAGPFSFLRASDEDAGQEDQSAAEDDLCDGEPEAQFEKVVADVADRDEFNADHEVGKVECGIEVRKEKGERVENAILIILNL